MLKKQLFSCTIKKQNIGIIQYIFINGPVLTSDLLKKHGNSKENGNLFSRTFQTTKNKMKSTDIPINEFRSLIIDTHGGISGGISALTFSSMIFSNLTNIITYLFIYIRNNNTFIY